MHQPPLPLQDSWTFSFDEGAARGAKQTDYEGSLRSLGSFDTVQGFWRYWNALSDKPLPEGSNLRLFKHDITPSWEHPANTKGGRWVFVVPKESTKRIWTALILALIGDQFSFSEDVCGAVLSTRFSTDTINLWNRDATSQSEIERCTTELSERLQIVGDAAVITEYKAHQQSLENNRSFAKIASSSGRIKRRYSVNTLRTHSGTASISPRASPRLSTSDISSDDATIATPSPPRSPRAMPSPISRAASTPAVLTLAAPPAAAAAHQRRSSPQPIHSPTLSPSTSSSPGSAGTPPVPHAPAPASGTPPKQRQLSLSSEDKRHKRDRSRGDKSKSVAAAAEPNKPAPVPPAPAEAIEEAKGERKAAADSPAAKRAAPVPPVIAVSAPSDATSAVRITVAGSELKSRSGKSLSPVLLCTYLVFVFSVLVGVALVVLRPTAADALMRSLW